MNAAMPGLGEGRAAVPEIDPVPATLGPSFDTVRVDPDGRGLVAGQAEPGGRIVILSDDDVAAEATADQDGRFVAFVDLAPSDLPRTLSLRDEAGQDSEQTVIVAPTPRNAAPGPTAGPMVGMEATARTAAPLTTDGQAPPSAEPEPPPDVDGETGNAATERALDAGRAQAPAIASSDGADAFGPTGAMAPPPAVDPGLAAPSVEAAAQPPVLLSDEDGVRVLQPALAPGAGAELLATVALDAITYDGSGEVTVAGRGAGAADGAVRLYLDNRPVAEAPIGSDGGWQLGLPGTAPGVYTLRVDQLNPAGQVVSRIETPFQREERADIAAVMAEAEVVGSSVAMRTVQPGNTLWAIARERYGEPLMYVRVFEANRDRIRDPDLIYPGQVFVLPTTNER
ncbi:Ig-like domain-containing protein [Rubellimicrobium arenae]|uniref:Ig-like domain-containing protein n=1 Tax=Rubellimicrobium arenae TaxID=2817372 RepID=UPI001B3153DE|nr:Ig-like domain-containing protein [Rubellimicrobium arenae]